MDEDDLYDTMTRLMENILYKQSIFELQLKTFKNDLDEISQFIELYTIEKDKSIDKQDKDKQDKDKQDKDKYEKQIWDIRATIMQNTKDQLASFKKEIKNLLFEELHKAIPKDAHKRKELSQEIQQININDIQQHIQLVHTINDLELLKSKQLEFLNKLLELNNR